MGQINPMWMTRIQHPTRNPVIVHIIDGVITNGTHVIPQRIIIDSLDAEVLHRLILIALHTVMPFQNAEFQTRGNPFKCNKIGVLYNEKIIRVKRK